jgi:hypothetical protein
MSVSFGSGSWISLEAELALQAIHGGGVVQRLAVRHPFLRVVAAV